VLLAKCAVLDAAGTRLVWPLPASTQRYCAGGLEVLLPEEQVAGVGSGGGEAAGAGWGSGVGVGVGAVAGAGAMQTEDDESQLQGEGRTELGGAVGEMQGGSHAEMHYGQESGDPAHHSASTLMGFARALVSSGDERWYWAAEMEIFLAPFLTCRNQRSWAAAATLLQVSRALVSDEVDPLRRQVYYY